MPKGTEPLISSTGINEISLKDIFDAIQRQNELPERSLSEIRRQITRVNEENGKRIKEIKTLSRTLTEMKTGTGSVTLGTEDFGSVLTDDETDGPDTPQTPPSKSLNRGAA
jgi:hypothetical protein